MIGKEQKSDSAVSRNNIAYYNKIANEYEAILDKDAANAVIRDMVANKFLAVTKPGYTMDFGGGTGMDIGWLTAHGYKIIFCEPSIAMRDIAMQRTKIEFAGADICFLDDAEADFRNWLPALPFMQKANAVLANFAVINCIPDISFLFEKLSLSIQPGGVVLALMLDNTLKKRLRSNFKGTVQSFFSGRPVKFLVEHSNQHQSVYIHSDRSIKKASNPFFDWISCEHLNESGFCLIHLVRK
jgi:SAM-dependent methyltransferase